MPFSIHLDDLISVTEANRRGLSAIVREAEAGADRILIRNNRPVAALVSIDRLKSVEELYENLVDIAMMSARMVTTGPERHSLEDVFAEFGVTLEELLAEDDEPSESVDPA